MIDKSHIINSIRNATEYSQPWRHFYIHNFLDYSTISKINQDIKYAHKEGFRDELAKLIDSVEVRDAFGEYYDFRGNPEIYSDTYHKRYIYPIHKDMQKKRISMILYLGNNPESDGTKIFSEKDEATYKKTAPFINNGLLFFQPDLNTWHSYGPFEDRRTTITLFYVDRG